MILTSTKGECICSIIMLSIIVIYLFHRIRELTSQKIGTLLRITGQVVRTHPVHPELVSGTFICLDCQTVVKDVEQQFKYTQVLPGLFILAVYSSLPRTMKNLWFCVNSDGQ